MKLKHVAAAWAMTVAAVAMAAEEPSATEVRIDCQPLPAQVYVEGFTAGMAALSRTQVSIQLLLMQAFEKKSKNLLLQALLLDPVVNSVVNAEKMLDYMLVRQKAYLSEYAG